MNNIGISYTLKRTPRARNITIKVTAAGEVIVSAPKYFVSQTQIAQFVQSASSWIEKQKIAHKEKPSLFSNTHAFVFGEKLTITETNNKDGEIKVYGEQLRVSPVRDKKSEIEKWLKNRAIEYMLIRLPILAKKMDVTFRAVSFKKQSTRWGSCSSQKNLNFNWKLIHAPKEVIDYVLIHELAHLTHMNHSSAFWDRVAQFDPDYPHHRRWLHKYGETED
ncbi:MAG TPA: SprT family zinc-dependent metalloprotease [Patescibacteria group bacterium]|nr:SprT family zinc-dependent metalloprotease [Patescibacteria group bacterium]